MTDWNVAKAFCGHTPLHILTYSETDTEKPAVRLPEC